MVIVISFLIKLQGFKIISGGNESTLPTLGTLQGVLTVKECKSLSYMSLKDWPAAHAMQPSIPELYRVVLSGAVKNPPSQTENALNIGLDWLTSKVCKGVFVRIRNRKLESYIYITNQENYVNPIINDILKLAKNIHNPDGTVAYPTKELDQYYNSGVNRAVSGSYIWHDAFDDLGAVDNKDDKEVLQSYKTYFVMFGTFLETIAPRLHDISFFAVLGDQMFWPESPGKPLDDSFPTNSPKRPSGDAPIMVNFSNRSGYNHLLLPTVDDMSNSLGKLFPSACNTAHYNDVISSSYKIVPWNNRKSAALFRGSPTGFGQSSRTNARLDIANRCLLLHTNPQLGNSKIILDAGLTRATKARSKLYFGSLAGKPIIEPRMNYGKWKRCVRASVPFIEWGNWKYLISIDGNVVAFRLATMFAFGSVVILYRPVFDCWVNEFLKPRINCIIAFDYNSLVSEIEWAEEFGRAEKIGAAGRHLFETKFSSMAIQDYAVEALNNALL